MAQLTASMTSGVVTRPLDAAFIARCRCSLSFFTLYNEEQLAREQAEALDASSHEQALVARHLQEHGDASNGRENTRECIHKCLSETSIDHFIVDTAPYS